MYSWFGVELAGLKLEDVCSSFSAPKWTFSEIGPHEEKKVCITLLTYTICAFSLCFNKQTFILSCSRLNITSE